MAPMRRLLTLLLASTAVLAACGEDNSTAGSGAGGSEEPAAEAREAASSEPDSEESSGREADAAARGPLLKLRDSQFGPVLFSGGDRALYFFTRDPRERSRCYGACAVAWPPFYANARPRAGRGVEAELLGTVRRRGGRRQVTYKGQPLYFYVHDPRGKVLCNDIVEFGGTWFALDAAGDRPA